MKTDRPLCNLQRSCCETNEGCAMKKVYMDLFRNLTTRSAQ